MPDNAPSSAPQADTPLPLDDLTAAAVLRDDGAGPAAGGTGPTGAATPNGPIAAALPHDGGQGRAEAEARTLATAGNPAEPGHETR